MNDRIDWTAAFQLFPGDVSYVWHASLYGEVVATALRTAGLEIRSQIIWCKQHFALSRGDYHWRHENLLVCRAHGSFVPMERRSHPDDGLVGAQ